MGNMKREDIECWYDRHSDAILKFILMLVKDYQQAEDLTHETFVKAYLHYDSFHRHSSEKTWLFRIAHNLTIDYFRRYRPLNLFKDFISSTRDGARLPQDMIELKETSAELYHSLEKLKEAGVYEDKQKYTTKIGSCAGIYNSQRTGIALIKNYKGHYFLPGGGLESDESLGIVLKESA